MCDNNTAETEEKEKASIPSKQSSTNEEKDGKEEEEEPSSSSGSSKGPMETLQSFMANLFAKLNITSQSKTKGLDRSDDIEAIVNHIKSEKCKNIIVMAGAGISTSAGIPDFRSPNIGLYANIMRKHRLLNPTKIFEIEFFKKRPEPFYSLCKELFPEKLSPTPAHYFVRLLDSKGLLLRHYTQNIDGLERLAEIPDAKIVEAHGSFHKSHCINEGCEKEYSFDWMKEKIFSETLPKCTECDTVVKPDVVFFGQNLPVRFFNCMDEDFSKCDLLIIMGTSLVVQPFASLVDSVPDDCPKLLINRELVGTFARGVSNKSELNKDVAILGDCDDGVRKLAKALGWEDDLNKLCEQNLSVVYQVSENEGANKMQK